MIESHANSPTPAAMQPLGVFAMTVLLIPLVVGQAVAQGFKFSQPDESDRALDAARQERIAQQLSTPCRADLKDKKIVVVIGELQSNGIVVAQQQNYGPHFQAINGRLRALGLRTYTPEEIRRQIAQAEIDAYFRNDPDAALAASRRLGASFVLRGLISSQATMSPIMAVNQVSVNMAFTHSGAKGRIISDTQANSSSYSGADVSRMALTLVDEKAEEVVARLYADYCSSAGLTARNRPPAK
jgi:acid stress-induced BolA-like protein IbaG/YrbA